MQYYIISSQARIRPLSLFSKWRAIHTCNTLFSSLSIYNFKVQRHSLRPGSSQIHRCGGIMLRERQAFIDGIFISTWPSSCQHLLIVIAYAGFKFHLSAYYYYFFEFGIFWIATFHTVLMMSVPFFHRCNWTFSGGITHDILRYFSWSILRRICSLSCSKFPMIFWIYF